MAVYTEISDEELRDFVAVYDIGQVSSLIAIAEGVENSNYLLITDRDRYILTIYEKRVRRDDLPYFLGLMTHLAARGVACPVPVAARDGVALREIAGKPAAMVTFLKGVWPRRVWPEHCQALGNALAELHLAGQDFAGARANDLSVASWRGLFAPVAGRAESVKTGLAGELDGEIAALQTDWPEALPSGVIHADLFPDNVFFENNDLTGVSIFISPATTSSPTTSRCASTRGASSPTARSTSPRRAICCAPIARAGRSRRKNSTRCRCCAGARPCGFC